MNTIYTELTDAELEFAQGGSGAGNILTQNAQDNSTRTTTNQQWLNLLSFNS